jgi:rhodanese-related sulfurtransferase
MDVRNRIASHTMAVSLQVDIKVNRIDLEGVVKLQEQGAQVLEVLSRKQFDEQHIPGAISLPLSKFKSSEFAKLDRSRPVIVYCWDYQ